MLKSIKLFFLMSVAVLMACEAGSSEKELTQLNDDEFRALHHLTLMIYNEVTDNRACFLYTTEFRYLPTRDDALGKKLRNPIKLYSYACVGPHMILPQTLNTLQEEMKYKYVTWTDDSAKKRSLRIVKGFIRESPGGAGGYNFMSNDMATIIPEIIEVQ